MNLSEVSVRRPVFATMMSVALVVVGAISYGKLGVDLLPKVEMPVVSVFTSLPGAGPEEIESAITKPIEEQLNTIAGIDELMSVNREGFSYIRITFTLDRRVDAAVQDVRDKIGAVLRQLPEGTDPPSITAFDSESTPIMAVAISGPQSLRELTEFADTRVKDLIGTAPGVGQVSLEGGRKRAVNVVLDTQRIASYGLTSADIKRAIQSQNVEIPGGRITRGEREDVLRTMARIEDIPSFERLIVANDHATNAPIRLGDVAHVEDGTIEPRGVSRLNRREAVTLTVQKQSGANLVETAKAVEERLDILRATLPAGSELLVLRDSSIFVKMSAEEVQHHLVLGGILASLMVLLFMGSLRSTLIAAVAIPASLIATFAAMKAFDFTLNNITLLALTLAVGIVIDDAIVVIENIHRHMTERGISAMQAAIDGTREITLAVAATTLSLVVIFMPIAFMTGQIGRLFSSYGITVAVAVLVSLFISLSLTPMLASRFLKEEHAEEQAPKTGWRAIPDRINHWLDSRYEQLVAWSLDHRLIVLGIVLGCVALTAPLFGLVKKDFLPEDDQSEFEITMELAPGTSFTAADSLLKEIEPQVAALPGVKDVLSSVGDTRGGSGSATRANLYVGLVPIEERKLTQNDVMLRARRIFAGYPDMRPTVRAINTSGLGGGGYGGKLKMSIRGPGLDKLEEYLAKLLGAMRAEPAFVDAFSSSADRLPEVRVEIDRAKAADLGIDARAVSETLRTMVGGEIVSSYRDGDERYDVWLRLREVDRANLESVGRIQLRTRSGGLVPLEAIARLEEAKGPTTILRLGGMRQVFLSANPAPGVALGDAVARAEQLVQQLNLPPGYDVLFSGDAKTMAETATEFAIALALSMVFVYMVLAAQFESFVHPITILLALPLTLPFALLSLVLTGESLNVYSALGVFMLLGVVKKNGILQVDYTNTLRKTGIPLRQAILAANRARLRPILMTTLTLIAAMVPMTLAQGPGAASRGSLAKVIVGGQALSLVITLLIVPVAYAFFDELQERLAAQRGRSRPEADPALEP
ncbi:efflux RND transporter permease subunit [Vulgatibacter incomptus]|uniref:RND multidrug efflux transporter n=1 Tax=Vulgatibacter incomptus TaxID=1391653 RepID=A0A0K1P9V6_9BACT|nr:efflux RND transporter permease subunit [Vulgatibacter incomptus]AKU90282.1 RND multidrug efflux transporter [Vulgatibacter incomptus]